MTRTLIAVGLFLFVLTGLAIVQDAKTVLDNTSKAMGTAGLTSITYSGTANDVNVLQTKHINGPWPLRPIANYIRAIDLTQTASRASGATNKQGLFGGAPVAGVFNQAVTP